MEIKFKHVVPAFLAGTTHFTSEVWNTDLVISSASRVLVRAQSGRGKTTFLSYLFGARKGYTGNITFNDRDIAGFSLDDWSGFRKDKMTMVFQDMRLFENMTVRENLEVKMKLTNAVTIDKAIAALDKLGIGMYIDRPCKFLSMGQQQRVSIVRALMQPFNWLLMDEPFSHLDETNTGIALELINEYCSINKAGFVISSLGSQHHAAFDRILEL